MLAGLFFFFIVFSFFISVDLWLFLPLFSSPLLPSPVHCSVSGMYFSDYCSRSRPPSGWMAPKRAMWAKIRLGYKGLQRDRGAVGYLLWDIIDQVYWLALSFYASTHYEWETYCFPVVRPHTCVSVKKQLPWNRFCIQTQEQVNQIHIKTFVSPSCLDLN